LKRPSLETISLSPQDHSMFSMTIHAQECFVNEVKSCLFMLRMASQGRTNACENIYQDILFLFQIDTGRVRCVFHTELICSTSIGRAGHAETTASGGLCDA